MAIQLSTELSQIGHEHGHEHAPVGAEYVTSTAEGIAVNLAVRLATSSMQEHASELVVTINNEPAFMTALSSRLSELGVNTTLVLRGRATLSSDLLRAGLGSDPSAGEQVNKGGIIAGIVIAALCLVGFLPKRSYCLLCRRKRKQGAKSSSPMYLIEKGIPSAVVANKERRRAAAEAEELTRRAGLPAVTRLSFEKIACSPGSPVPRTPSAKDRPGRYTYRRRDVPRDADGEPVRAAEADAANEVPAQGHAELTTANPETEATMVAVPKDEAARATSWPWRWEPGELAIDGSLQHVLEPLAAFLEQNGFPVKHDKLAMYFEEEYLVVSDPVSPARGEGGGGEGWGGEGGLRSPHRSPEVQVPTLNVFSNGIEFASAAFTKWDRHLKTALKCFLNANLASSWGDERELLRTGFGFGTEWNVEAVTALQIFLKKNGAADLEITQRMGLDGNALFGVCDKDPTIMALQAFLNRQLVPGAPIHVPAAPAAPCSAASHECTLPITSGAFAAALAAAVAAGPPSAAHPMADIKASAMLSIEDPPQLLGLRDGETRTLGRQHMSTDDPACKMLSREQVIFTFVGDVLRATKIGKAHSCLGSEPGRNLPMNESIELKDGDKYYLHYSPERGPIFGVTVSIAPATQEGWQVCSGQASPTASSSRSGMGCSSCTCTSGEALASPTSSSSRSAALKRARAAAAASSCLHSPEPPAPTLFKRWTHPKSPPAPQPQLPPPTPPPPPPPPQRMDPQRMEATPEAASGTPPKGTPPSEEARATPPRAFEYEPGAMAQMRARLESSRLAQVVAPPSANGHEEPASPLKSAFRWLQQLQDQSQGANDEDKRAAPTDMDLDLWI